MSDIVSPFLQWLNANPNWAGLATFIISAAESVAIIGTVVPGSITMTAIGTLAGAGVIPLWETIIWAIIGAVVGDGISYWIGHYFKERLRKVWPFRNNPSILKAGEVFVHKYGVMSVFIGRFVGPVRALVPLVAGMLGMKPLQFTIANITSAIGWAPAYMLPGILLGAASLELPPDIALHGILVLLLIALFILLCLWSLYKLIQLVHHQTTQLQNLIWTKLKNTKYLSSITVLLRHHGAHKPHGQLTLAFYFIVVSLLFLALACYVRVQGAANILLNDVVFHLFRGLSVRSDKLDNIMINITLLAQKQVILPVVVVVFCYLLLCKRFRVALHALALGIFAAGGVFVVKHIVHSPRPWGILQNTETYSMPSGHTTLATTLFLGFALLIGTAIPKGRRWPLFIISICAILAVSLSRLYLGAHWLTDIVGAWLLSAAILMFIVLSYQRLNEKPVKPLGLILVTFATYVLTYGFFHYQHFAQLKIDYAQVNYPTAEISMEEWWQRNNVIPKYRVSLFGFPSQRINIEWLGDLHQIRETLIKEGWSKPPARDWVSTLHRITDISSTEYLPMISPQYLDKKPALILTYPAKNEKGLLVIRLWDSNRYTTDHTKLWVGIIGTIPRPYSWLFNKHPGDVEINSTLLFTNKKWSSIWQWEMMTIKIPTSRKQASQKIILIRSNTTASKQK